MYELNGYKYNIVRTWVHEGESPLDLRIGKKCYYLESESKRFSLTCLEEDLEKLEMVE